MKIKIKILIVTGIILLAGCSEDYLNTEPTSSTATGTILATTESAKFAVNGLAKLMSMQYLTDVTSGLNGEGTIKMYYGNYAGAHFSMNLPGWSTITNQDYNTNLTSVYCYYPWYYYYRVIGNANPIITYIDNASGPEAEKQYIKAQALTYRAYSFMMLSQMYCLRWADSNNGASLGLVLRTDDSDGDMARSTLLQTYEQIYKDLDEAISLFTSSGMHRAKGEAHVMDKEIAYAIYARAALTRQDYPKAEEMAVKARESYPLMTVAEYGQGFCEPTQEWIWGLWGSAEESLFYYSYQSYISYNSTASQVKSYPKCISKELFDKIPDSDIRKKLFLNPADYPLRAHSASTGQYSFSANTAGSRWLDTIRTAKGTDPTANIFAYMQFKIAATAMPAVGHTNIFRTSEMYLIEAEAKYFQNKPEGAQDALIALNKTSGRDVDYTCTKTGADLLEEIKVYRGLELWGEGFDWFDMKRWNVPMSRKSYANGGSFVSQIGVTFGPEAKNKWTWFIPSREIDYNKLIEQNNYGN